MIYVLALSHTLVPGIWYLVPGSSYPLVPGTRYVIPGSSYQVPITS